MIFSTRQRINSLFENFGTNTADKLCGSCAGAVSAPFCFFGCGNSYSSKIITAPYFSIRSPNCLHSSRITLYSVHSDVPEQSSRTRCLLGQVLHHCNQTSDCAEERYGFHRKCRFCRWYPELFPDRQRSLRWT